MRILIWAVIAALLSVGTALASDDSDNWGTPYYDQVITDSHTAAYAANSGGCASCGQAAQGGCSHCGKQQAAAMSGGCTHCGGAPAPKMAGCSHCGGQQAAAMGGGCAHCGGQVNTVGGDCATCGQSHRSGCSGDICGTTDYDDWDSAWAWMFD